LGKRIPRGVQESVWKEDLSRLEFKEITELNWRHYIEVATEIRNKVTTREESIDQRVDGISNCNCV